MTLSVDIAVRVGDFDLETCFESTGRVTSLFGRSGAGKTTALSAIAGLVRPHRGRIAIDGEVLFDRDARISVPVHRRRIGFVFQEARLFPHRTVHGNLIYGRRRARGRRWADYDEVVDLLGIRDLAPRRTAGLSGGEAQRVAIARALLASPRLLLLDEPLAAVDVARRNEILPYLETIRDRLNIPIVHVSHSADEVMRLADDVVLIDGGRSVASGPLNDIFAHPDVLHLTAQLDAGTTLEAKVIERDASGLCHLGHPAGTLVVHDPALTVGATVRIRIRARDVAIGVGETDGLSIRNRLAARITAIDEAQPPFVDVRLDCAGDALVARITAEAARALDIEVGREVTALVKTAAIGNRDSD